MMKRTRLIAAAVTLAALATTGTASAATSGSGAAPGAAKSDTTTKVEGKAKPASDADFAAMAAKLGVTTDRLTAALIAAKRSLANAQNVTPQAFVAAVATNLGIPASRVKTVLEPMLLKPGDSNRDKGKKGADDPRKSPFTTDAAAARLAATLGCSKAKAKAALLKLVSAQRGIEPASQAFRDIAKSLGVSAERLDNALRDLKQSMAKR
ncbi:hypothetical protein ACFV9C_09160 [Kribbella sp. NPDC059898]|uniref:hypothetical protein n=1 Tax=Kribbella sp. NPDC059898 TaxID=3346995 RepID=UPI0036607044